MSHVKIWIHLVFATKYRDRLLTNEFSHAIHEHIMTNCTKKGIFLQAVNGSVDHIHCLISLGKDQTIAQIAQLIKGESSFWINKIFGYQLPLSPPARCGMPRHGPSRHPLWPLSRGRPRRPANHRSFHGSAR